MTIDLMRRELVDLAAILGESGIRVFVGGGYGLWLKAEYLATNNIETLRDLPTSRTTQDIDLFLGVEVITDSGRFAAVRDALTDLGYESVSGAEHYQFFREIPGPGEAPQTLKIDLLAPPVVDERVKMDDRRIRPRDVRGLHAHVAPEAVSLELLPFELGLGDGVSVLIPHPFTFLMMKLFAFRDQAYDEERGLGRYHAYDLVRIVAMMTAQEWDESSEFRSFLAGSAELITAREIVASHFSEPHALGIIRLREHAREVEDMVLAEQTVEQFSADLTAVLEP